MRTARPRILAIEPDSECGERLHELLSERLDADVTVVRSGEVAVRSLRFQIPDLVVASMLLPPGDEAQVMAYLNAIDGARTPAVLIVPPMPDETRPTGSRRLMLHLGLRSAAPFPLYDADAIAVRIQEALESRGSATAAPLRALRGRDSSEPGTLTLALVGTTTPSPDVNARSVALVRPTEMVIARAHRWTPAELPWVCSVQAPSGLDARVINVSRTGILIESGSKLMPGSVAGVHLCGPGTALVVPARVVRSEVASIDVAGVKYLIAAAFDGRLDPLPEQSAVQSPLSSMPRTPAELRVRVAAEVDHSQRPADITVIDEDVRELTSAYHMKDGEDFRLLEAAAVSAVRVLKDDARRLRNAW